MVREVKIDLGQIASNKPVVTILTIVAATVAIVVGGIVTITNPQTLTFHQYVQDIAFMAGALGLGTGIGRGIDSYGQSVAQAQTPLVIDEPAPVPELPPAASPDPLSPYDSPPPD